MRKRAKWFAAMIAIGFALAAGPASTASAAPAGVAVPNLHYAGQHCKTLHSPQNWAVTICVITNADDALADQWDQALVTFQIRSGSLAEISVSEIYLYACEGFCVKQHPESNVVKFPSGRNSFISNPWTLDPNDEIQAVVTNPCVQWTNGQAVCWSGTHKDTTISTH